MVKKSFFFLLISVVPVLSADLSVRTVDLLGSLGLEINGAGPVLVQMDEEHGRLIVPNTLSSSISLIDTGTHRVKNIALGGRALQHLKAESMTYSREDGTVYLIGTECIFVISPVNGTSEMIGTEEQFESIAVDPKTGNVFVAGRESALIGFLRRDAERMESIEWLDFREDLTNLNQTPPPPIRKVISAGRLGKIIGIDGYTAEITLFDGAGGAILSSRPVKLTGGGRWHLAGYNEKTHFLYLVIETSERKVIEAAKIDIENGMDTIVSLPGFSEGVGITYNPKRDEIYIPYDNHPSVHVVNFGDGGSVHEIKIPAYGNDSSALDREKDILYVGSWAFGEIDVIDLETRTLVKRIKELGILPHMFTMAFDPVGGLIYFPRGATAVNGTFGSALTTIDPRTEEVRKIRTGWAAVDLITLPSRNSVLVFDSEDRFAEVREDGSFEIHTLPCDFPVRAGPGPGDDVYLSYGPHQTYWPVVYIWGAKNGILTIDAKDLSFYDRRIPRQAHDMVLDRDGVLYFTQNNWGKEEQFLGLLEDGVRVHDSAKRILLGDEVERETTQRLLRHDPEAHLLFLVRVGETDAETGVLQVIDPVENKVVHRSPVGITPTDMILDAKNIYISNFDSDNVSVIDRNGYTAREVSTGRQPLKLCRLGEDIYVINHGDNSLQNVTDDEQAIPLPSEGRPDNVFVWNNDLLITSHTENELLLIGFDPDTRSCTLVHSESYPYGDTRFDTGNVSFYLRGQFGDAVFSLTDAEMDESGDLWVTDLLSGRLLVLKNNR